MPSYQVQDKKSKPDAPHLFNELLNVRSDHAFTRCVGALYCSTMPHRSAIRLLTDPPLTGPINMARDEALLERVGTGGAPPTLRLYQWSTPTISLGYFQHYADYEQLPPPAGLLPAVRRQTGGGAILHDLEQTYSLTLPIGDVRLEGGANQLYERAHTAITECLLTLNIDTASCGMSDDSGAARGPFFCFERRHRYDLLVRNDKIAGSAQRRTKHAVLQHGSIILANRFPQQPSAFVEAHGSNPVDTGSPNATTYEVRAAPVWYAARLAEVRRVLPTQFARALEAELKTGTWNPEEIALADHLKDKYAGDEWTKRS